MADTLEDNPYLVELDPEAFHELLSEYETYIEWSAKTLALEDPEHLALAQRVLNSLYEADARHVCVDEFFEAELDAVEASSDEERSRQHGSNQPMQ